MLQDESDRRRLQDLGTRCFGGCDPNIDALAHELGPQVSALLALVTNPDAARVPSLIAALPEAVQERMGGDRKSTRPNSRRQCATRMTSSAGQKKHTTRMTID